MQGIAPARRFAAPTPLTALVVDAWPPGLPRRDPGEEFVLLTRAWGGRAHAVKALPEAAAMSAMSPPYHIMFNKDQLDDPGEQQDEAELREKAKSAGIRPLFMTPPRTWP